MRTSRDDEHAAPCREGRAAPRAAAVLGAEHAAKGSGEPRGADEQERTRPRQEAAHRTLQIGVRLGIAHDDVGAGGARLLEGVVEVVTSTDRAQADHPGPPAARRLDGRGHARIADRVLRVARERRPVHRHAADHLAPLLGRPSDLGNGGQDEGLTDAEDIHRGVDLGTEGSAEPRVDLLEDDARPPCAQVRERPADPARRLGRRQRPALRVAHAERAGGAGAARRRLHDDAGRPRQHLGAHVAGAGQIVSNDAQRMHER